jgi:hypothetical protein
MHKVAKFLFVTLWRWDCQESGKVNLGPAGMQEAAFGCTGRRWIQQEVLQHPYGRNRLQ